MEQPQATWFQDLAGQVTIPADGTISRTLYRDEQIKVVLFGFAAGQELSEHTAAVPALIQIIAGEATIMLGDERVEAQAGTWVRMPAHLTHAVTARTPVVMLLTLLR
jgi:quercetin dioxygenase-like cupin family protein